MTHIIGNYEEMKKNFKDLMNNLKETNSDQERIIHELKVLKQEYENK
jgi:predicted nuclease with TOPRIM domain